MVLWSSKCLYLEGATRIPWFSFGYVHTLENEKKMNLITFHYSPFHGAMGVITSRMLIHIRKFALRNLEGTQTMAKLPDLETGPVFQVLKNSQSSEGANPEMRCIGLKSKIRQNSQNSPAFKISESWSAVATESHSFNVSENTSDLACIRITYYSVGDRSSRPI